MAHFGQAFSVPVLHASDFSNNIEWFYARHAHTPLIIRGAMDESPELARLDRPGIEAMLQGVDLWAYDSATLTKGEYLKAEVLFADMTSRLTRYNVVDHSVLETPLAPLFSPPAFLRHNWFAGSKFDTDRFVASVNCSVKDSYSPIHVDPYGMQGWMCLLFGRKRWRLYAPEHIALIYDMTSRRFFHRRFDDPQAFPLLDMADYWEGEIEAGDLMYFPAGWAHEVVTFEESFGIGGAIVNDFQIIESMRSWLWEYSQSGPGDFDFVDFVASMAAERPRTIDCAARTAAALKLHADWQALPRAGRYGGAG